MLELCAPTGGRRALTYAVAKGNVAFVGALLAHRADVNAKEDDGGQGLRIIMNSTAGSGTHPISPLRRS